MNDTTGERGPGLAPQAQDTETHGRVTEAPRARPIEPAPTPEEAAAIIAALQTLRAQPQAAPSPVSSRGRSRWRLAGLLGHTPRAMNPDEPLWSYSRWGDVS